MTSPHPATELLAPAGEKAAAYAAFAFGADAIYTGLPRFSARAEADNLSAGELEEVIAYAHALPRPRRPPFPGGSPLPAAGERSKLSFLYRSE